jgi:hypothetical protein
MVSVGQEAEHRLSSSSDDFKVTKGLIEDYWEA